MTNEARNNLKRETLLALKEKILAEGVSRNHYVEFDKDFKPVCFCAVGHLFNMTGTCLEMFDDEETNLATIAQLTELEINPLVRDTGLSIRELELLQQENDIEEDPEKRAEAVIKLIDKILQEMTVSL